MNGKTVIPLIAGIECVHQKWSAGVPPAKKQTKRAGRPRSNQNLPQGENLTCGASRRVMAAEQSVASSTKHPIRLGRAFFFNLWRPGFIVKLTPV
ncbi:MAG: hypothetical protein LBI87_11235 [Candidatus Accumulibacter sp.]|jgi:hypothetical protein|nr:hypothetical protein [Accumulibacter sp.]